MLCTAFAVTTVSADVLNVAVASNFTKTLKDLAADFESQTGHRVRVISGSTGKLFTQVKHGAPFDVFLAADEKRPELLVAEGLADASSDHVYARGRLVFVSNISPLDTCQDVLMSPELIRLSIANPKTAPYGLAAKQVLQQLSVWESLKAKLVRGENIAQATQFVSTQNAQAGFIARSLLQLDKYIEYKCTWDVPLNMYAAIKQKMVVLSASKMHQVAREFHRYIQSERAKKIIRQAGYDI